MFGVEPAASDPSRRRWFPGLLAWLIGTPVGVVMGCGGILAYVAADLEHRAVPAMRAVLSSQGLDLRVGDLAVEEDPDGVWRVVVKDVAFLGGTPYTPTILADGVEIVAPSWMRHEGRWMVQVAEVHLTNVTVLVAHRKKPEDWTAHRSWLSRVEVGHVSIDGLDLLLPRDGHMTEVLLETSAADIWGLTYSPGDRVLHGEGSVASSALNVAGMAYHGVHATMLRFDGVGMEVHAAGHLGALPLQASLRMSPLFRPPKVTLQAHVEKGRLHDLTEAILGDHAPLLDGVVTVSGDLEAGHHLGPGAVRGRASVDLVGVGLTVPEDAKPGLLLVGHLLPFLRVTDRTVHFGELAGEVSYTEQGVAFDEVTYDAPHSVGQVAGYVHGDGLSAMMQFRPKPHSGAIGWGFVVHGALQHPKVALATATLLDHWTPCADPLDCAVRGGTARSDETEDEDEGVVSHVKRQKLVQPPGGPAEQRPPPHERHAARTKHPLFPLHARHADAGE